MERKPAGTYRTIQAVDRTFAILESLARSSRGLSLSELSKTLYLAPQTLQSLLRTLQVHRWVVQEGRGKPYQLGPAPALLYRRWSSERNVVDSARPFIRDLCRRFGEYAILAEWAGGSLSPLVEAHPDRELIVRGESSSGDRLHTMATGKILMAFLDDDERRKVVSSLELVKHGPNSVTDPDELMTQLDAVRREGFIVCEEEAAEGVAAAAVPVISHDGRISFSVGVSLPLVRYTREFRGKLIPALRETSEELSSVL